MNELTARQRQLLNFIRQHHDQKGYWPSVREIQARFRIKSTNGVFGHLKALERKGAISRVAGHARAFRSITPEPATPAGAEPVVDLPVFGSIAAGFPDGVESGHAVDRLQVNLGAVDRSAREHTFALKVRGDSMVDAGINDGDDVVVERRPPRDGDIVVALIDGQSTLKRLVRPKSGRPFLRSENRRYPVMHPLEELVVQGVATALVRRL